MALDVNDFDVLLQLELKAERNNHKRFNYQHCNLKVQTCFGEE